MNNKIVIRNREPQEIKISGGGEVVGITTVLVNGIDVTEGNIAYVVVPTKLSELENNMHFISEEVDPTVPYYVKQITQADINKWNNKQDLLVSGTNIKTINGNSIMGSGNLTIDTSYTAGTGIEINDEALKVCQLTLKANDINATLINLDFTLWDEDIKFDVIVSNPPYFDSKTIKQRNVNKNIEIARHEGSLTAASLCKSIAKHLNSNGRAYLVYRPNRLNDLEKCLNENNLYIQNYQDIYNMIYR